MKKTANSIVLSKRMQAIVDLVDESSIADIGCDHAFVSIELAKSDTTKKVIAMDVRKGPLAIATSNIRSYGLADVIEIRLSDGFAKLVAGEVDCAILAGMGGLLMVRILEQAVDHLRNGIHLILQPQSEFDSVRAYLFSVGYRIIREEMLIDEGKYYTVLKAVPTDTPLQELSQTELLYGPLLLADRHPILKQYLEEQLIKNQALYEKLSHINTDKASVRVADLKTEIAQITECLSGF